MINNRLVPVNLRDSVERVVQRRSNRPKYLFIGYRDDPCDEVIVAVEPEDEDPAIVANIDGIRRGMEEGTREMLNSNGVLNARNLMKSDARIWVKSPVPVETIDGLDVDFSFGGNPMAGLADELSDPRFLGTLTCSGTNDYAEISVRLVTNEPLEDENGREVYHVDLNQSSIDTLHQNPADGRWTIRLPDRYRPAP
ncbi:MAG: hypothetical protein ABI162_13030 [Luteolibacter sp.]